MLTFVRSSWGNHAGPVAPERVATVRKRIGGGRGMPLAATGHAPPAAPE